MDDRLAQSPRHVPLVDLLNEGFLDEHDVLETGHVRDSVRVRAEARYAEFAYRNRDAPSPRAARPTSAPVRGFNRARVARRGNVTGAHVHRMYTLAAAARHDGEPRDYTFAQWRWESCCICYTKTRDHVLMPCFHMCVCVECAARVKMCPLCRRDVDAVHRVFV